jgi:4-amino-4-deoxychorismate lyase
MSLAADKIWRLQLAWCGLTQRHAAAPQDQPSGNHQRARAEYLISRADEVLLANERGEICEGTIIMSSPISATVCRRCSRLDCGLLPGVLRGALLDEGGAREAIYTWDDLKSAKAVFLGNSLRGLIPARLG